MKHRQEGPVGVRTWIPILLLVLTLGAPAVRGHWFQEADTGPQESPSHRFQEVAPGVYFAQGTGSVLVMSNSMVVINESDVLIVDSHVTPAAARALVQAVATLTDKPIRYVVNTHYHFDHAHGNQIFGDEVEVIGHQFTRRKLLGKVLEERTYRSFTSDLPQRIERMRQSLADTTDPAQKARLAANLRVQEDYALALKELRPTPPNLTLEKTLSLYRGGREIQLHFFGRGHTGGDVVVYLPRERIVFTGDLLLPFPSYMGDGYVQEWPATLEALKSLDFDRVLPGHGQILQGKSKIDHFQAYLRDLWGQVEKLKAQGLSPEDAAGQVDLTGHREHYPIPRVGADLRAVQRMYELMDGE